MARKTYFKFPVEEDFFGEGTAYIEYDHLNQPVRQVNDYDNILLYSFIDSQNGIVGTCYLSDQYLDRNIEESSNEISEDVFYEKWSRAIAFNDNELLIDNRSFITEKMVAEIIRRHSKNIF